MTWRCIVHGCVPRPPAPPPPAAAPRRRRVPAAVRPGGVSLPQDGRLIRGASEDNAIVLTENGVKNGPLRFKDEFVRHKILDLIGDLALLGHRILGKVVANRAGHAMHTALVSRLLKDHSLWEEAHIHHEEASPSDLAETETPAAVLN